MLSDTDLASETILIIDDTPANLSVLSDMLSEYGYRILVATDGISALEQIEHLQPDLILLDIIMPGIDGFETCRRLKKNQNTKKIPIIFMTGLSELDNLLKGFKEGAVDYIVKPIRPSEVLARVEAQLSQKRDTMRIEQTLNHIEFAALTFNDSGRITWLSNTADSILSDCFSTGPVTSYYNELLPPALHEQLLSKAQKEKIDFISKQSKINYIAKLVSCSLSNEQMLFIEKNNEEWNQASLKITFGLTAREAEILMWVSRGKTNKEVGLILDSSPRTINKHLEHVFEKLGVPTRTAAVVKVLKK
ncbi:MAG: response regulator [Methylococcales bacterium]